MRPFSGPAEPAPAKINLFLHITGRRPDGYHLLDSLVIFAPVGDTITATPAETLSLTIDGPFAATLQSDPDNLVLRAARALAAHAGIEPNVQLRLTKTLPVASGIGGGSADAAATLRLLARLWRLPPPPPGLALALGADVPVCLANTPARMQGIGETLAPAPALPAFGLVLVNPGLAVPTPAVFKARTGPFRPPATLPPSWPSAAAMARALAVTANDLEPPAISLSPVIADVLQALRAQPATLLARMSGSGATCLALCPTAPDAEAIAQKLARTGWWTWGGGVAAHANAT